MIQEKLVDFTTLPNSQLGTKFIGFDLDGKLKSKDSNGTIVEIGSGNTGSGGTFTYKKHASMSPTGNVGLLAMSDVYALVPNPQGPDDFEVTAKIANTEPGIPGNKAVIGLLMPITPYIEPRGVFNPLDKGVPNGSVLAARELGFFK